MSAEVAPSPVPILIVDDNAAKRLAVKAVLQPLGYPIVEADSGVAALRCVMTQDFAVILLDVCMPMMDGFETAELLRQREQSEMTPIIFFTAYGSEDIPDVDRYSGGAVDFMFAPVPPNELRAKVSVFANLFIKAEELAKQARQVQASADRLRLLTEAAPIGIFQTDAQNRYVYTNPRWSEITGIPREEATTRVWDATTGRVEIQLDGADPRIVLVTSRSIPDSDDSIAGWVGTLADVTAEAMAEAAMARARDAANEASRLKSDFLANMSHEIRTPMNGVIGMTDLLLETDLDDRQRDYAQTVRNSGEALMTIINDILDFSKVEAGMLEVEDIEFSVRTVVSDVVDLLVGSASAKGLALAVIVEDAVPAVVCGDPGRVRQVLTNLIGNAIKFTQEGEIGVRVTRDAPARGDAFVRFEISDTGDGIATDNLALIFQPFVQADTSTSRKYGGTGLGLAISGQLVALMGGDCGVSSRLGEGSNFWFTIRARAVVGLPALAVVRPHVAPPNASIGPDGEAGWLLLVEDNAINQKVALAMLAIAGYRVDTVRNGLAAVEAAAANRYDAILMDCHMPELSGYEATAAIRAQEELVARHTPIIAMTAGARPEDRDRCIAAGMDGYLAKPVSKDALLALVAQSLRGVSLEAVVDETVLDELRVIGEAAASDLLGELVDQFVDSTEPLLVELGEALDLGDDVLIGDLAHRLKGSAAQLGGRRLASSCDRLGRTRNRSDFPRMELDYQDLRDALRQRVS